MSGRSTNYVFFAIILTKVKGGHQKVCFGLKSINKYSNCLNLQHEALIFFIASQENRLFGNTISS